MAKMNKVIISNEKVLSTALDSVFQLMKTSILKLRREKMSKPKKMEGMYFMN